MKDKTSQAIALVGIALLMLASDGNALLFDEAIKEAVLKAIGIEPVASKKEKEGSESLSPSDYVYGIRGLSDYLGVSPPTAQKYMNSGLLDGAINGLAGNTLSLNLKLTRRLPREQIEK